DIKEEGAEKTTKEEILYFSLTFGIVTVYVFFLNIIGFGISTILLISGLLWLFKFKNIFKNLSISVLTTIFIIIIFQILLKIPLPKGILDNFYVILGVAI